MTIYDIAKQAGVSASTVSRVINNKPGINAQTRKRVQKLLNENHYTPNEAARGLVMQSSKIIGILIEDLRIEHMKRIREMEYCSGFAIGGLAVGEPTEVMYNIIEKVEPFMPKDKPRYLMGVGTPTNIIEAVYRGVDFFDCVMPSRNARHGTLFTWNGIMHITNKRYETDSRPIDEHCDCPACRNHSRAYIRHLFKSEEQLGGRLAVMHNLYFYNTLTEKIREALDEGRFEQFRNQYSSLLASKCED